MYYVSFDAGAGQHTVGLARSADGFTWTKAGPVFAGGPAGAFDAGGAAAAHVVRAPASRGAYRQCYEAVGPAGERSIGVAASADGLRWERRAAEGPVLAASDDAGAWDAGGVGAPCAVDMAGGRWRLYYEGRASPSGAPTGVGLALSAGEGGALSFRRRKA